MELYLQYSKVKTKKARHNLNIRTCKTLIDIGKDFVDLYEWEYEVWVKFVKAIQPITNLNATSDTNKDYQTGY